MQKLLLHQYLIKPLLLSFIFACIMGPVSGQLEQWHKIDSVHSITSAADLAVDNNNNIYVSANGADSSHTTPVIVKHNPDGSVAWNYAFGGLSNDVYLAKSITDGSGNSIIVGSTPNTNYDAVIAQVTPFGTPGWNHVFNVAGGYDGYNDVITDASANIYATGTSSNPSASDQRIMVTKLNSAGSVQWSQYYSAPDKTANGFKVRLDSNGDVVVGGEMRDSLARFQMQVVKYNPSGTQLWHQEHLPTGPYTYQFKQLVTDNSGNIYVFANLDTVTTGFVTMKNKGIGVVKMNSSGAIQWARKYFNSDYRIGRVNTAALAAGTIVMGGTTDSSFISSGFYTALDAANGDTLWYKRFRGTSGNGGSVIDMNVSGNSLFLAGLYGGIGTSDDYFTAKVNPGDGTMIWSSTYNGFSNSQDAAYRVAADHAGSVIVSGGAREYVSFAYNCTTVKYADATGIDEPSANDISASFFPQPFHDHLTLSITMAGASPAALHVCDVSGKTVAEKHFPLQPGDNSLDLDFTTLASGLYICDLQTNEGNVRRKIICRE